MLGTIRQLLLVSLTLAPWLSAQRPAAYVEVIGGSGLQAQSSDEATGSDAKACAALAEVYASLGHSDRQPKTPRLRIYLADVHTLGWTSYKFERDSDHPLGTVGVDP